MISSVHGPTDDHRLVQLIKNYSASDDEYWSFKKHSSRNTMHVHYQYPAMMVPQLQEKLITAALLVRPKTETLFDPFVGSGTVLAEAMLHGRNFIGTDVNPLAVLLSRVKAENIDIKTLEASGDAVLARCRKSKSTSVTIDFPGLIKWFRSDVAVNLSKLREAIRVEKNQMLRRFLWVCLAETVRLTSNARTSTYKLYARTQQEARDRELDVLKTFSEIHQTNVSKYKAYKQQLALRQLVINNDYFKSVRVQHSDCTKEMPFSSDSCDLLISSPPYGDNKTTVSYGQQAYLPLQWIDLKDIQKELDASWLENTMSIDSRSLGGNLKDALDALPDLAERSPLLATFIRSFPQDREKKIKRIVGFFRDLDLSLEKILPVLKPDAYMMWTVGNRRVDQKYMPMDEIFSELLVSRGAQYVYGFTRRIPSKRLGNKIGEVQTMSREHILIYRKSVSKV